MQIIRSIAHRLEVRHLVLTRCVGIVGTHLFQLFLENAVELSFGALQRLRDLFPKKEEMEREEKRREENENEIRHQWKRM